MNGPLATGPDVGREERLRKAIRGILGGCWASAGSEAQTMPRANVTTRVKRFATTAVKRRAPTPRGRAAAGRDFREGWRRRSHDGRGRDAVAPAPPAARSLRRRRAYAWPRERSRRTRGR